MQTGAMLTPHRSGGTAAWVKRPGVELLGEYQGGGWTQPHYLVKRADGQFLKLTGRFYQILESAEFPRTCEEIGQEIGLSLIHI